MRGGAAAERFRRGWRPVSPENMPGHRTHAQEQSLSRSAPYFGHGGRATTSIPGGGRDVRDGCGASRR
ncbi:MAG: hypothetical protein ACPIOQ_85780, partial [Promethearchaeia archaeon]